MSDAYLKLLVTGALGRMGEAVIQCTEPVAGVTVTHKIDVGDSLLAVLPECDMVIDFSFHAFTTELARACVDLGKSMVIGTTGHSDEEIEAIRAASEKIPIVFAPNYSVGVNLLFWLSGKTAEILGDNFDIEVTDMHHRLKKDAPSGTAKRLVEILAEARGLNYNEHGQHGREGIVGERPQNEIGVHSLRGGDVVGDHTVTFASIGERVELTHKASSRDTFANGAIRAAAWLRNQPAGLYDMQDVLELK
ncbi:MAG: 4-hydroxy-tetrahydrodipicolinate reductase [Verrucomicrobiales bacterium]|jgi:4-hydroxy-tetrahydrodipicolinate reductase